jgi:hypothetical protein
MYLSALVAALAFWPEECVAGCVAVKSWIRCASGIVAFKHTTQDSLMHLIYDYVSLAVAVFFVVSPFLHFITYHNICCPSCSYYLRSLAFLAHHVMHHMLYIGMYWSQISSFRAHYILHLTYIAAVAIIRCFL